MSDAKCNLIQSGSECNLIQNGALCVIMRDVGLVEAVRDDDKRSGWCKIINDFNLTLTSSTLAPPTFCQSHHSVYRNY